MKTAHPYGGESERLQRTYIWPAPLRLSHWLMVVSVVGLWISGWFMQHLPGWHAASREQHLMLAWLLVPALALRLLLLFTGKGSAAGWRDLLPQHWQGVRDTLRFYVTFGQLPLPRWYAHNPLWAPVYLLFLVALLAQTVSGFLLDAERFPFGFDPVQLHAPLSTAIGAFMLLHVIAVLVHDWRSGNSDVSAMLHGYRIFRLEKPRLPGEQVVRFEPQRKSPSEKS